MGCERKSLVSEKVWALYDTCLLYTSTAPVPQVENVPLTTKKVC